MTATATAAGTPVVGELTVTNTVGSDSGSYSVDVSPELTDITISGFTKTTLTSVGDVSGAATATAVPAGADLGTLVYSGDADSFGTVDSATGEVTAVADGVVNVSVTNGTTTSFTSVEITVSIPSAKTIRKAKK